jgi:hypothetical protein
MSISLCSTFSIGAPVCQSKNSADDDKCNGPNVSSETGCEKAKE